NACPDDFANACRSIADKSDTGCLICTGFFIPQGNPPAFETDGPLGVAFLLRTFRYCKIGYLLHGELDVRNAIAMALEGTGVPTIGFPLHDIGHVIAVERAGPAADKKYYTMRGIDISDFLTWNLKWPLESLRTIGIGDGGNEIGMGKIPHETIVKNIPNGDLIHCRVATDHLIVAGVSNWGAYALAAGVALLRGVKLPAELFDPERERAILQTMVDAGPLVDGVTGKQTATVDGLSWEEYIRPLLEIARIVEA
ncbi:MAG TPA: glutamate cyclase domain-containing protein, partial [Chloroflexota bacterium]|nr:glutamate cyclase domain-containing protein [Chloroflexota bacterium]